MRARVLLGASICLNALLAFAVWRASWAPPDPSPAALPTPTNNLSATHTNVVVRRLNFVWAQIESEDYARFIANLRNIGCPESTIRDIIVADINQLFARRRATGITTPTQQWWRSDPDPAVAIQASSEIRALESERRALLAGLLGPDWESSAYPFPEPTDALPLDGPLLGTLPAKARAAIHGIERAAAEKRGKYLESLAESGQLPDGVELARMRAETRQALAKWMDPAQLEEYLLRYSQSAAELRRQLRGVIVTPEEFRGLFKALDRTDPASAGSAVPDAASADRQRDDILKQTLGAERFEQLKLLQDPLYQEASEMVRQADVSLDHLVPLAAILRLTQEEETRIRGDYNLTPSERLEQLQAARQAQLDSLRRLMGTEAFDRYLENHPGLWDKSGP